MATGCGFLFECLCKFPIFTIYPLFVTISPHYYMWSFNNFVMLIIINLKTKR